jgi:hypothetical protein
MSEEERPDQPPEGGEERQPETGPFDVRGVLDQMMGYLWGVAFRIM